MTLKIPETEQIYDDQTVSKISQGLGIDNDKSESLREVLERAARQFIWLSQHNSGLNEHQTHKKLLRLANHMEKSVKLFHEITKQSKTGVWDIVAGIESIDKNHKGRESLLQLCHSDYFITSERVMHLLDALKIACEKAPTAPKSLPTSKWTKTQTVLAWIWDVEDFWRENSKVPLTEGRCEEEGKYNSKAVNILDLMAAPINKLLPSKHAISNSMNAEAIRLWRESASNDSPRHQHMDEDCDFQ